MSKPKKIAEPFSCDELADKLAKLNPISAAYQKERKTLLARYSAGLKKGKAALSLPDRALRGVFPGLFTDAYCMAHQNFVPLTSDEQVGAEYEVAQRWNALAANIPGLDLRLEVCGTQMDGGLRFVEKQPGDGLKAIELLFPIGSADPWLTDVFIFLSLLQARPPVNPAAFKLEADRAWDRLRHTRRGMEWQQWAADDDATILAGDSKRKANRRHREGLHAVLDACAERWSLEGIIPPGWPMQWRGEALVPMRPARKVRKSRGTALLADRPTKLVTAPAAPGTNDLNVSRKKLRTKLWQD